MNCTEDSLTDVLSGTQGGDLGQSNVHLNIGLLMKNPLQHDGGARDDGGVVTRWHPIQDLAGESALLRRV